MLMNPLSAMRSLSGPEMALPLARGGEAVALKPIPFSELKELGAAAPQTLLPSSEAPGSFGSVLGRLINEVNDKQAVAGEAVRGMLNGQNVSLHQAVISMEEASVSFQLMVEVRNKLLDSYQELMRMQI